MSFWLPAGDRSSRSQLQVFWYLLFNAAHPDPSDPRHRFGVDDEEGFVQDGQRWRFIGACLIYGHGCRGGGVVERVEGAGAIGSNLLLPEDSAGPAIDGQGEQRLGVA
ncbi:MAG: hypothetical protein KJ072_05770 [Verrucomicrobia bacterium]|nr:hypothetical protein [Verrucomicrobiota bacterium]